MICPNCKNGNEQDALFCVECGEKLVWGQEQKPKQLVDKKLASVGGWLVLFLLGLFIGFPLTLIIDINEIMKLRGLISEWFFFLLLFFDVGRIILAIFVGVALWMKKRYAPLWAEIHLIIALLFSFWILFFVDVSENEQYTHVKIIIFSSIWLAYFFNSKRVKAVYFPEKVELYHKP